MSAVIALYSTENLTEHDAEALKAYYEDLSADESPCKSISFIKTRGRSRRMNGYRTYAKGHFVHYYS